MTQVNRLAGIVEGVESLRVSRTRMSSTESWLAFAIRNIPALLGHYCYHAPDTTNQGTLGDIASFRRERRAVAESPLSQFNQQGRRRVVTAENLSVWTVLTN